MRIAYFVHGRGRGHASRSSTVIQRLLDEGHDVHTFAGGDAWDLMRALPQTTQIRSVTPGVSLFRDAPSRVCGDRALLRALQPDVVVSDGDMPSVLAAKSMGIRAVSIGHDLVFARCKLPEEVPMGKVLKERINSFHTRLAPEGVAVNFLPVESACERTVVARPDFSASLLANAKDEGHIVAYFRDPNGERIARSLARQGREVRFFSPRGEKIPGVDVRPICRESFVESMASASAIVGSIGSNLVAESIALGKPFLGVHKRGDAEQALNAGMVRSAHVGMVTTFEEDDPWVAQRFMERVELGAFRRVNTSAMRPASEAMSAVLAQA